VLGAEEACWGSGGIDLTDVADVIELFIIHCLRWLGCRRAVRNVRNVPTRRPRLVLRREATPAQLSNLTEALAPEHLLSFRLPAAFATGLQSLFPSPRPSIAPA
jgi:hypothetical protein